MTAMTKRLAIWLALGSSIVLGSFRSSAEAGVLFFVGPGAVQPAENVLFNEPNLVTTGSTIEGITNVTQSVIQFTSNDNPIETLTTPAIGQARIESTDGSFSSIMIVPKTNWFMTELEFNANVLIQQSGTLQLSLIDQFNNVINDTFNPNTIAQGQNFFSFQTNGGTLIKMATITASSQVLQDVRQVRVSTQVPEPGSLGLLVGALPLGLMRLRSRSARQ